MKLLGQFYACLAIIAFIAVIGGSEAAVNRRGLADEQEPGKQNLKHGVEHSGEPSRHRRHAQEEKDKPEEAPLKHISPPRQRRNAPNEDEIPKEEIHHQTSARHRRHAHDHEKPETDEVPEKQLKRNRRQMPGGDMPNPEDLAKQIPMPGKR